MVWYFSRQCSKIPYFNGLYSNILYFNGLHSFNLICHSTAHAHSPPSFCRKLFTADVVSKLFECGLKHFSYFSHIKISCLLITYAVFIRFMMVTRGEDIRMASKDLRPNQASLRIIIFIAVFGVIIGYIIGFVSVIVLPFFPNMFLYQMICRDSLIENTKEAIKITKKGMLINLALLFISTLLCFYNKFRVNRYIRGHGRSYFSHTRQNIITFRQVVKANYIYNLIHMGDMLLMCSIRHPYNPFKSHQDYKDFMKIYYSLASIILTTFLPQT